METTGEVLGGFSSASSEELLNDAPALLSKMAAGLLGNNVTEFSFKIGDIEVKLGVLSGTAEINTVGVAIAMPDLGDLPVGTTYAIMNSPPMASANLTSSVLSFTLQDIDGAPIRIENTSEPFVFVFEQSSELPENNTIECTWYNTVNGTWDTDGCVYINGSCACNHLTQFSTRFKALADTNLGAILSIASLFAGQLAAKIAPVAGTLAGVCGVVLAIALTLIYADRAGKRRWTVLVKDIASVIYLKEQKEQVEVDLEQKEKKRYYIDMISIAVPEKRLTALKDARRASEVKLLAMTNSLKGWRDIFRIWLKRLPYQHFHIGIFMKYDPKLPRLFRAFYLIPSFLVIVTMSVIFYGYRSGTGATMTVAENVVLTLMTLSVSLPINKLLRWVLNHTGQIEYEVTSPDIAREERRRHIFARALGRVGENVLEDIDKFFSDIKKASLAKQTQAKPGQRQVPKVVSAIPQQTQAGKTQVSKLGNTDIPTDVNEILASVLATGGDFSEEGLFQRIWTLASVLLCKRAAEGSTKDEYVSFKKALAMIKAADKPMDRQACISDVGCMRWFPVKSWPAVLLGVGETIGCLILCFYILGFAGYKSSQDAMNILETVGISQASAILITAPLTQLVLVILGMIKNPGVVEKHYQLFLNKQATAVAAASYGVKDIYAYLDSSALKGGDLSIEDCKKLDKLYAILFRI